MDDKSFPSNKSRKTEIIVFGNPSVLHQLSINGVFLHSGVCIRLSPVVKRLGFRLDSKLTFSPQVTKLKSALVHKLRKISRMKSFLTIQQTKMLIEGAIISSLDYCNSLYYGCHQIVINQLQSLQNRACRVIFGMKRRESVERKMKDLHWLKIEERIRFKLLLTSLHGISPVYLCELLSFNFIDDQRAPSLHTPSNQTYNKRAFQSIAAELWNELPSSIRGIKDIANFKRHLKTHLFTNSYK